MVYVYLPFMLFPMMLSVAMVPNDTREAARDLGASRWQVFREVELPLSMPGILIGCLLTFVLAVGAIAEAKILGGQRIIPITHDIEIAFTYSQTGRSARRLPSCLCCWLACSSSPPCAASTSIKSLGGASPNARFSCSASATGLSQTVAVLVFVFLPGVTILLASLTASRYFTFPIPKWGFEWWDKMFSSQRCSRRRYRSRGVVMVIAVAIGFAALAFARYDWRGRSLYQRIVLLPIFFPQTVLGLAMLLWFNAIGLELSWKTAVFAHLVWIVPVVTLVMAIQLYSFDPALEEAAFDLGASRWQVFREVTPPVLFPGIFSGALFAFLLSWGNFPLSLFTTGADTTVPGVPLCQDGRRYTPGVPVLGTVSTIGASLILLGGYVLIRSGGASASLPSRPRASELAAEVAG